MSTEQAPWWLEAVMTFVGIVVAAVMVTWQQRATARANMKLKLFETLREAFNTASDACIHAGASMRHLVDASDAHGNMPNDPVTLERLRGAGTAFIDAHGKAGMSAADLLIVLEQHDIVSKHFLFFRKVIRYTAWDVQNRFDRCFKEMTAIRGDPDKLREAGSRYCETINQFMDFISDIQIEIQNLLVTQLFRENYRWRLAARRQPADPRFIVIRTDSPHVEALIKHFDAHAASQYYAALSREAAARADSNMLPHPPIPRRREGLQRLPSAGES